MLNKLGAVRTEVVKESWSCRYAWHEGIYW